MAKKQVLRALGILRPAKSTPKVTPKRQTHTGMGMPSGTNNRPIVRRKHEGGGKTKPSQ
jgi:hypothetical protein